MPAIPGFGIIRKIPIMTIMTNPAMAMILTERLGSGDPAVGGLVRGTADNPL
jgi:hypothetical protein